MRDSACNTVPCSVASARDRVSAATSAVARRATARASSTMDTAASTDTTAHASSSQYAVQPMASKGAPLPTASTPTTAA